MDLENIANRIIAAAAPIDWLRTWLTENQPDEPDLFALAEISNTLINIANELTEGTVKMK